MSTQEVALVVHQVRERLTIILSPSEMAQYDAYQERLQTTGGPPTYASATPTPAEQAVLDTIAADADAAVLHRQLRVLLRIETLPQ